MNHHVTGDPQGVVAVTLNERVRTAKRCVQQCKQQASTSPKSVTHYVILLPPIYWSEATISVQSRSCLVIAMKTTIVYTHVLDRGVVGVNSPADLLFSLQALRSRCAGKPWLSLGCYADRPSCLAGTAPSLRNPAVRSI